MEFEDMLAQAVSAEASDLFVKVGVPPSLRIDGQVVFLPGDPISDKQTEAIVQSLLDDRQRIRFEEEKEVDVAYTHPEWGRFRVNLFRQQGYAGAVFRRISREVPSLESLNLPAESLKKLAAVSRGLFLVSGLAGSGKSTTLAAMVEHINQHYQKHVVTLEDPIEYIHQDKKSIIDQREIGLDTRNFHTALKHCVRQSPDVILIGEMRDLETMEAAITAAETGHLVLSSLHTPNASQTLERVMNFFPPHQHDFLRTQLSLLLLGILSQRLLPLKQGRGRVPAYELLVNSPTIRELLQAGKARDLAPAMREGGHFGNIVFNQTLRRLYEDGRISLETALAASDRPDELNLEIRGIRKGAPSRSSLAQTDPKRETRKP